MLCELSGEHSGHVVRRERMPQVASLFEPWLSKSRVGELRVRVVLCLLRGRRSGWWKHRSRERALAPPATRDCPCRLLQALGPWHIGGDRP